jgi:hypothetical protein
MSISVYAEPWGVVDGAGAAVPADPPQPPRARTSPQQAATSGTTDLSERRASRRSMIFMINERGSGMVDGFGTQ